MMKVKIGFSEKIKSNEQKKSNCRFLITISVLGSTGPIRFVVNGDDDNAEAVIGTALKVYGREGRLPVLGYNTNSFSLYPANGGFDALRPSEAIGSRGVRNFILIEKNSNYTMSEGRSHVIDRKGRGWRGWRAWLHKSLSLKILFINKINK